MGTASFAFDARDGARTYRAFTVGGLGLNRIRGPEQVEAFIDSVKRIRGLTQDGTRPVELHLTTRLLDGSQRIEGSAEDAEAD